MKDKSQQRKQLFHFS